MKQQNQVIPGIMNNSGGNSKDWRQSVGQDIRQYLVQKIVRTIFPTIDVNTYRDSKMINLVAYAEKLENEMNKSANTREEYLQLLAKEIYKIQKELEEKRQNAKESRMQQQEVGSSLEPMLSNNSGTAVPKFTATGDQKQINPQESRRLAIQRCIAELEHACQCRDAICRLLSCQKMKRIVSHAKTCKRKCNGSCVICKQLIALNCYHAKNCQETKCPVPFCLNIKHKLKQQRMAQAQNLKRRIASIMQNRGMTETIKQTSPGSSNPTNQPSPDTKPLASKHNPQPGIGMKPSACPPVGALQGVQQVQAAAARLSVPHMVPTGARPAVPDMVEHGNYGISTIVIHRNANPALICSQQQHMQKPMNQMMPEAPNGMRIRNMSNWDNSNFTQNIQPQNSQPGQPMGLRPQSQMMEVNNMPNLAGSVGIPQSMSNPGTSASSAMQQRSNAQVPQQLPTSLKSLNFSQQKQQVLHLLKSNPQLMAAFLKHRSGQPQQIQQQQQQQQAMIE